MSLRVKVLSLGRVLVRNGVIFVVLLILGFLLPRLIPGSPLSFSAEEINVLNLRLPEETFNRFRSYYMPEKPLYEQFFLYMRHLFQGDWGYSFHFSLPVMPIVLNRVLLTLFLTLSSSVIAVLIAIPLGVFLALSRDKDAWPKVTLLLLLVLQTTPAFLLAVIFRFVFAYQLGWFPTFGAYPPGFSPGEPGFGGAFLRHALLPVMVLVLSIAPSVAILTRNVVFRTKKEPYVQAACYFGISGKLVRVYYIFLNSLPEISGRLNIVFLHAISGALFVEMVFSYPGMGALMKLAVGSRDYPLIQGIFLVTALFCSCVNTVFELLQSKINPRLRPQ